MEKEVKDMRIVSGLDYYQKLDSIIQECVQKAQENPFEEFIFIAENKKVVEKMFLKYTRYLVNIEILSWKQYLKQLQITYHKTKHHVITQTEFTYHLQHIFHQHDFHCFHAENPYPIIQKMIPLMKDFDLSMINYQAEYFNSQPKLVDYIHIYQYLLEQLDDYTHLSLESIFNDCLFDQGKQHIYIEADHLYQPLRQDIIKRLDQFHDMTLMYTYHNDQRLMNMPYHLLCQNAEEFHSSTYLTNNLFLQSPEVCQENQNLYTFIASSPQQEVKHVVNTIYQKIVDEHLHYKDFMIIYPDTTYVDILIQVLKEKNIPHHLQIIQSCQYDYSYQWILKTIDELSLRKVNEYAHALYDDSLDEEYKRYLESLFEYNDLMTPQEFKEFFMMTCVINHCDMMNNQDYVSIEAINQAKVSEPQHIFILGMNETVLPHFIKDTSLLLNEDIHILRQNHISTPLTTLEQLGVHHNDILKALSCPCMTMTFSCCSSTLDGQTLLPSSLYKQLQHMYQPQPLPLPQCLSIDDYYLKGGQVDHKEKVNHRIHEFISHKNQPNSLNKETIQSLYSPTLSVSQIETYNKCPFLYFIQYGLGIYPTQDEQLRPNELGSLVHYVLSMNINHDYNINELVDSYIIKDEVLSKKIQSSKMNQYFIEQLKKDLVGTLEVLHRILDISSFSVHSQEEKIEDVIQGMKFKGFVDRIDTYQNYVSIIDYKSSAKDIDLNLAMQGFNIQMLLYLKMVTKKYDKDPGAVLYFNTKKRILNQESLKDDINEDEYYALYRYGGYVIDDDRSVIQALDPTIEKKSHIINVSYVKSRDEYKGHILTHKQLDLLLQEIELHIQELYLEMMNGNIMITPTGSDQNATHTLVNPCHYCPYHSICQFDPFYNDYKLVEFYDIEEKLGGKEDAI